MINFPGSAKACSQCMKVVEPVIKHAIDLLKGNNQANELHEKMNELRSKVLFDEMKFFATVVPKDWNSKPT